MGAATTGAAPRRAGRPAAPIRLAAAALQRLRRHPVPMRTHFRHSLVLTWAVPPAAVRRFLVPGLELDTFTDRSGREWAFVAAACVELDSLRPAPVPARFGGRQLMVGYRVFCTLATPRRGGGTLTRRGLRILASQATDPLAVLGANLTTRYHYRPVRGELTADGDRITVRVRSRDGRADIDLAVDPRDGRLPEDSVFATAAQARRFAGPLPYTFSPDPDGIVVVRATRTDWSPEPVRVLHAEVGFFAEGPFAGVERRLSNAFHVADVDYGWQRGQLHRVETPRP